MQKSFYISALYPFFGFSLPESNSWPASTSKQVIVFTLNKNWHGNCLGISVSKSYTDEIWKHNESVISLVYAYGALLGEK